MSSNCLKHKDQEMKLLCLQQNCVNRLVCENCIDENHEGHEIIYISKRTKQFTNLSRNSRKHKAEKYRDEIRSYLKVYKDKFNEIDCSIKFWKQKFETNFINQLNFLIETFSDRYFEWAWQTLNNYKQSMKSNSGANSKYQQDLQSVISAIKFLNHDIFDSPDLILEASNTIFEKVCTGIQQCKEFINKSLIKLSQTLNENSYQNIDSILRNKSEDPQNNKKQWLLAKKTHDMEEESALRKMKNTGINYQIQQKIDLQKSIFPRIEQMPPMKTYQHESKIAEGDHEIDQGKDRLLEKYKEKMLLEVFGELSSSNKINKNAELQPKKPEKSSLFPNLPNPAKLVVKDFSKKNGSQQLSNPEESLNSESLRASQKEMEGQQSKHQSHMMMQEELIKVEEQYEGTPPKYQCTLKNGKFMIRSKSDKILDEETILKQLLGVENPSDIEEIEIGGLNKFNEDCLQILATKFKSLKKLYYIYNYDRDGVKLQLEQVFFQKIHNFRDDSLPVSQQNLNIFSLMPHLENLLVGDISQFDKAHLKIKNQKIRNLTIGDYLQNKTVNMPLNLMKQIRCSISNLETLNLFNIKSLPIPFLTDIFEKHVNLKQLWISECDELQPRTFKLLSQSKLETLIFDQLRITDQLQLPRSLSNLIIDNCTISNPIMGIDKVTKGFKNFSIFESKFERSNVNHGDHVIKQLLDSSKQTLQYLNVGQNDNVTDQCLNDLGEMVNLRYLCINQTNIKVSSFLKGKTSKLKKLEKLDIMNLNGMGQKIIQKLGEIFPELTNICLIYRKNTTPNTFKAYKKLENLTIMNKNKISDFPYFVREFKKIRRGVHVHDGINH